MNREAPPPPYNAGPGPFSAPAPAPIPGSGPAAQHVMVEHQQHAPIYGPPLPIGIGGPILPFGGLGAFPSPIIPFGGMAPFPFSIGGSGGGPLAPICTGSFLPGAHEGIGFGLHGAGGLPFPPPPPGAIAGVVPPFAPMAPLWTLPPGGGGGGLAFGNIPAAAGIGGIMGGGLGLGGIGIGIGGGANMQTRPAPPFHDGNAGFPTQPPQSEPTQIPGGIPAGVSLIEPSEHTIVINIKGDVCPWLSPGSSFAVEALALGSGTGLNRLIQVCCGVSTDEESENMALTECIELGNGLWEKGQTFKYNDAVSRVLTMKDAGWDNRRNRTGGQSLHVWGHRV